MPRLSLTMMIHLVLRVCLVATGHILNRLVDFLLVSLIPVFTLVFLVLIIILVNHAHLGLMGVVFLVALLIVFLSLRNLVLFIMTFVEF